MRIRRADDNQKEVVKGKDLLTRVLLSEIKAEKMPALEEIEITLQFSFLSIVYRLGIAL